VRLDFEGWEIAAVAYGSFAMTIVGFFACLLRIRLGARNDARGWISD